MNAERSPDTAPGMSTRVLLCVGSTVRIAYGVGSLLAPAKMVSGKLSPDTHELADPRLLLRAFGGHQVVTGCMMLAARRSRRMARQAALASLLIDAFDVASALLEIRARGEVDQTTIGGIAISGTGLITFAAVLAGTSKRSPDRTLR